MLQKKKKFKRGRIESEPETIEEIEVICVSDTDLSEIEDENIDIENYLVEASVRHKPEQEHSMLRTIIKIDRNTCVQSNEEVYRYFDEGANCEGIFMHI